MRRRVPLIPLWEQIVPTEERGRARRFSPDQGNELLTAR